jgi:hypothetical protein
MKQKLKKTDKNSIVSSSENELVDSSKLRNLIENCSACGW